MERLAPQPECGWMTGAYHLVRYVMFNQKEFMPQVEKSKSALYLYLKTLQFFFDAERQVIPFDPMVDMEFLTDEEALKCPNGKAYLRFKAAWRGQYVYEMLRLGEETMPFHTLSHISGVHHVAMVAARGLKDAGLPLDLALASGSSAGHDLGKFGCRPGERVPYLHYYYTDEWFHGLNLDEFGHIAANHSTWDLELENLSAESLCLIYADFRVKQDRDEKGQEYTKIFSLKESFDVILSKLDNVDAAKLRRYKFVYARLEDFESYLRYLGVDVELGGRPRKPVVMPDIALRSAEDTLKSLSYLGSEHNIRVMHTLSTERQFGNLLEAARSEKNWKHIRAYLTVFQEYSTYLSFEQKKQTLGFLYELLMHREGDIRRYAAMLVGQVIAEYNAGYRKELPKNTRDRDELDALVLWNEALDVITKPDHKLTARHKSWLGYTLKIVVGALFEKAIPSDEKKFYDELMKRYTQYSDDEDTAFALLDALYDLPMELASEEDLKTLAAFAAHYFNDERLRLRMGAARYVKVLTAALPAGHPALEGLEELARGMKTESDVTTLFLQYRILSNLGCDTAAQQKILYGTDVVSEIFLDNLKTSTPWILKAVNIKLLADQADHGRLDHILHIATHLSNLIKVSEHVVVRMDAGAALLRLVGLLSADQRNEIAVELVKGLEVGEYEFSKYIPGCLGRFALWLPPEQMDELIFNLRGSLASANERIVSVVLETVGVMLSHYEEYAGRFMEEADVNRARQESLLGILLSGMANYREEVRQEAMWALQRFFEDSAPSERLKSWVLSLAYKKILFLMEENRAGDLNVYYRAALLSNICRFLSVHTLEKGRLQTQEYRKVAFFPGTFDPFTLSHKGIVRLIRDLGYEVYLAVDEFSWSKNTQPHLVRRQIVSMSVADEFHVHLFPDNMPVNIANAGDLNRLRQVFEGRPLYLVAGGDVVRGASAYHNPPSPGSVHSLNHILFSRTDPALREQEKKSWSCIEGEVIHLQLPPYLEDISSTRIRENIDLNRDISHLIDPVVQEYIYSDSRYLREAKLKMVMGTVSMYKELVRRPGESLLRQLGDTVLHKHPYARDILTAIAVSGDMLLTLRHAANDAPVGFARLRVVDSSHLMEALGSVELAEYVRQQSASGRLLLLSGVYVARQPGTPDPEQWLLAQAIAEGLAQGCNYAAYVPHTPLGGGVRRALERQGFVMAEGSTAAEPIALVDMHQPLVLLQNLETTFKAPFSTSPRLLRAVQEAHSKLQVAMTGLYPGQLVLSLPSSLLLDEMVTKMTTLNGVPRKPTMPRQLGPYMCVPFGKLMRSKVVPNTVTKTLHTDKFFSPTLEEDSIEPFPGYTSLESQIRVIKSFGRPVVLLDDILHKPGRLQAILPLFEKEGVEIKGVLLGVLSGYGRDAVSASGLPVDAVYSMPTLRRWFVESTLCPFIGGDTVDRPTRQVAGLMPSVNFIMPYAVPRMEGCSQAALFEFSEVCLKNARDIFLVLESEYRQQFGRNLTLSRLNEAVILPLCPDKGSCLAYDPNLSPSVYLENDLQMLRRTRRLLG
ncbi:MAG: cytidyltransferase-related domain protein [Oscillospiraceae bacterium]|nr:cytidyltransferase-related domain protein [Oscillospiraceae bacterium]